MSVWLDTIDRVSFILYVKATFVLSIYNYEFFIYKKQYERLKPHKPHIRTFRLMFHSSCRHKNSTPIFLRHYKNIFMIFRQILQWFEEANATSVLSLVALN